MNTMTTLFGGLAAVWVLYVIGGLIRGLPLLLRALLAGVIPLVTYFALIMGRWPGLDVVAMHISVYLVAALVLFALSRFRQRSAGRLHWAPKLLTGFFIGLVCVNAALLYISTNGLPGPLARWWLGSDGGAVYSGFSGVVSHDQHAAKAVSSELSEALQESKLGWQVAISGLEGSGRIHLIQVRVKDRTGLPVDRIGAQLLLQRLGAAAPTLTLPLDTTEAGVYSGSLTFPAAGRWLLEIQLKQDGKVHFHSIQEWVVS